LHTSTANRARRAQRQYFGIELYQEKRGLRAMSGDGGGLALLLQCRHAMDYPAYLQ